MSKSNSDTMENVYKKMFNEDPTADILSTIKINEIYRFNLKSLEDISKFLGIEYIDENLDKKIGYSTESLQEIERSMSTLTDKERETIQYIDSEFWEPYNDKFVYGEISKEGVNKLANYLKTFSGTFYDIGSGNGKLVIHLSLLLNFNEYIGVEIVELRHKYAMKINETIGQKVKFICQDVLELDISDANFIFLDDLMFPKNLRIKVNSKIPKECYYLTVWQNQNDEFIEDWSVDVSWFETEMKFYLYKKR